MPCKKRPSDSTLGSIHLSPRPAEEPIYGLGADSPAPATGATPAATPEKPRRAEKCSAVCTAPLPKATLQLCLKRLPGPRPYINDAAAVCSFARGLENATEENFLALHLDVRHHLIGVDHLGKGTSTGVEVHPREVFKAALLNNAAALIFIHNHPSGDPRPSRQDIELTSRLRQVGELHGISVVDHVVVSSGGCMSMQARGWLGGSGYTLPEGEKPTESLDAPRPARKK